jgi:hypothetical protein
MPTAGNRRLGRLYGSRAGARNTRSAAIAQFLRPEFAIVLQPLERRLKLLITVLHLLKLTGELTDLILQAVDPDQKVCGPDLCECGSRAHQGTNDGNGDTV